MRPIQVTWNVDHGIQLHGWWVDTDHRLGAICVVVGSSGPIPAFASVEEGAVIALPLGQLTVRLDAGGMMGQAS